jgi:hypothetical protein
MPSNCREIAGFADASECEHTNSSCSGLHESEADSAASPQSPDLKGKWGLTAIPGSDFTLRRRTEGGSPKTDVSRSCNSVLLLERAFVSVVKYSNDCTEHTPDNNRIVMLTTAELMSVLGEAE